ncbi:MULTISPECIES: O-fucosyltransferase family protein [Litoreibacter]|uniref:Nodulation protein Z (NodZ) n=2 Tax=Litoreibacter TaxID=947567 RepID=A0A1M5EWX4_9RHOB|nr:MULTISPECIES: O-fucosyltransferase family protein [Litoreibacter]SDW62811.1 hypothetical protein SAMN04488001_1386 [Litoreibacter albidus]SHF83679.1 hypothetical protein SAMN05444273_1167 [Litoreibacter ascidiaceicola]
MAVLGDLSRLFAKSRPRKDGSAGYLLIKRLGAGFWADVDLVVEQLLAAEIMGRQPIVQWGREGPYANGNQDSFSLYFQPVSDAILSDTPASIYPENWTIENLPNDLPFPTTGLVDPKYGIYHMSSEKRDVPKWHRKFRALRSRSEEVVVTYCWDKPENIIAALPRDDTRSRFSMQELRAWMMHERIHLQPHLKDRVDRFYCDRLAGREVMAVHMRGSDKVVENKALFDQNEIAFEAAGTWLKGGADRSIFLLTDSQNYVERWQNAFSEDRIILQDCFRTNAMTPNFLDEGSDGHANGQEIILDTYVAARCDSFVGNSSSNVAKYVAAIGNFTPQTLLWVDRA